MATKVINTILNMDAGGMLSGLKQVSSATQGLATDLTKAGRKSKGMRFDAALGGLDKFATKASGVFIGAASAFTAFSVKVSTEFNAAMSEVEAISGASGKELQSMKDAAAEAGATTIFSATDGANALKYMSLAGWSAKQSIAALPGVLNLAAASGMELAASSEMVTDNIAAFGLKAKDSSYLADLLTFAQNNSSTTAEQLGEAYQNCAANMAAAGQDVETTTAMLEALANQGNKGSRAGTSLAAMMRDITNSMEDGQIKIGNTAISVSDANGNFRDMTEILKDVESATDGMGSAEQSAALSSVFTADSIKGMNQLLKEGADNVEKYEDKLRNSGGAAEEAAAIANDNLAGSLKELESATEEIGRSFGDKLEEPMKEAVLNLTDTLNTIDWTALEEALGGAIIFGTEKLGNALKFLAEHGDQVIPVVVNVGKGIFALKAATSTVKTIKELSGGFKLAGRVGKSLFSVISAGNPVVTALRLALIIIPPVVILIVTHWKQLRSQFKKFMGDHPKIKAGFDGIKTAISGVVDFVSSLIDKLKNAYNWFKNLIGAKSEANNSGVDVVSGASGTAHNALGTPYFAGGWTKINEHGGEMAYLPGGSMIIPHDASVRAASAGGGRSININVVVQGNVIGNEEYADELGAYIVRQLEEAEAS